MAPGGRRTGAGMQSHAYCLSALYEGVDAISTKDGMVNEAVSEHTHILPYSPIALIQLLNLCSSPTWWLWRSGCTRSHSELGRETLQRQWYFVLRHGRVGRCQVCQAHKSNHLLKSNTKQIKSRSKRKKNTKTGDNIAPITRGGAAPSDRRRQSRRGRKTKQKPA